MDKKVYNTYTKKFFNEEGRFVNANNKTWLVLQDMFNWLGRLTDAKQIETPDRRKLNNFLKDIEGEVHSKTFTIEFNKRKGRGNKSNGSIQDVQCINIEVVPMVLTQFKPTKRVGEEKINQWRSLMKFINEILMELEVYKFITVDKEYQKDCMSKLAKIIPDITQNDYKTFNTNVANIMGTLIGVDIPVFKETLKIYNNQTTVDLLTVREEVLDAYLLFYETFKDYKNAQSHTLQLMKQRYPGINN